MPLKIIKSKEKKKILAELEEIYGITEIPYLLVETRKESLRAFSGDLSKDEIKELSRIINIQVGVEILNLKDKEPRLTFDILPVFKDQINKNIIEINKDQFEQWSRGHDLQMQTKKGTTVLKYQDDLVGVGKSDTTKIFNYLSKERRIKTQLPR